MIQQEHAPAAPQSAFALSAAVSPAVAELVDRVRPSVVQVRSGRRGNGTGVIWRASGLILTNDHVVAHARGDLQVTLTDGRTFDATLTYYKSDGSVCFTATNAYSGTTVTGTYKDANGNVLLTDTTPITGGTIQTIECGGKTYEVDPDSAACKSCQTGSSASDCASGTCAVP